MSSGCRTCATNGTGCNLLHPHFANFQTSQVLITSMESFAAIVVLLMLFWLVFAIVGLHVFGGLQLGSPAWPNCDTLIGSLLLNFHVSIGALVSPIASANIIRAACILRTANRAHSRMPCTWHALVCHLALGHTHAPLRSAATDTWATPTLN